MVEHQFNYDPTVARAVEDLIEILLVTIGIAQDIVGRERDETRRTRIRTIQRECDVFHRAVLTADEEYIRELQESFSYQVDNNLQAAQRILQSGEITDQTLYNLWKNMKKELTALDRALKHFQRTLDEYSRTKSTPRRRPPPRPSSMMQSISGSAPPRNASRNSYTFGQGNTSYASPASHDPRYSSHPVRRNYSDDPRTLQDGFEHMSVGPRNGVQKSATYPTPNGSHPMNFNGYMANYPNTSSSSRPIIPVETYDPAYNPLSISSSPTHHPASSPTALYNPIPPSPYQISPSHPPSSFAPGGSSYFHDPNNPPPMISPTRSAPKPILKNSPSDMSLRRKSSSGSIVNFQVPNNSSTLSLSSPATTHIVDPSFPPPFMHERRNSYSSVQDHKQGNLRDKLSRDLRPKNQEEIFDSHHISSSVPLRRTWSTTATVGSGSIAGSSVRRERKPEKSSGPPVAGDRYNLPRFVPMNPPIPLENLEHEPRSRYPDWSAPVPPESHSHNSSGHSHSSKHKHHKSDHERSSSSKHESHQSHKGKEKEKDRDRHRH